MQQSTLNRGISQDEHSAIRTALEDWADALRHKQAERVTAHHVAGFVQFSLAPPLVATASKAGLNAWFDTWAGPLGLEVRDLEIATGGDIAFCHSLNRMQGRKVGGETVDLWFRQTLCFRRTGQGWKFAHQHQSVPFYMDGSYRAAVDLTPDGGTKSAAPAASAPRP